jgi:ribonucleotide monophosphatase NagD (HAD superfamily)
MARLTRPSGLLIDLSGTIHIEDKAIPGAIEAVKTLRRKNIPFLFVTNTTKVRVLQSNYLKVNLFYKNTLGISIQIVEAFD